STCLRGRAVPGVRRKGDRLPLRSRLVPQLQGLLPSVHPLRAAVHVPVQRQLRDYD
ncbi:hypothetical protein AAVH_41345, partial [Aphelenchoides avenae]